MLGVLVDIKPTTLSKTVFVSGNSQGAETKIGKHRKTISFTEKCYGNSKQSSEVF